MEAQQSDELALMWARIDARLAWLEVHCRERRRLLDSIDETMRALGLKPWRPPLHRVLSHLAAGTSCEELKRDYGLRREDILDMLGCAAKTVSEEPVRTR